MNNPRYGWEDFQHPILRQLRDEYGLKDVVAAGKDEFQKQLLLKAWVHTILPLGNPEKDYSKATALDILADMKHNVAFYCTQYALVFLQCALALGWYSRKMSADYNHEFGEEEKHHGIADIWSNQFQKWYVVDPMHNLHYEFNDVPLNALEIRSAYLNDSAASVNGVIGSHQRLIAFSADQTGFDTPSNYFWFFILLRNNFLAKPGIYDSQALLWVDQYNKGKVWYKNGGKHGPSIPHPMYGFKQFIETDDNDLCFPRLNNPGI